jgi:eukaryotic-like serine/threonine-protein kinase
LGVLPRVALDGRTAGTMHDELAAGQVLVGKYRVERVLGVGGMGVVVAAHHLQLDERVAIKFMLREALENAEAVARFAREARAAVRIKSEHVARVSDVGVLDTGAPYMVMEYLDGSDLSAWLKQRGHLPIEQAVEFVLQASEAIAEAHALGIVHRDLKPANLFVIRRPDGALSVKVLDFGISKVTSLGSSAPDFGMTKTSAIMGSPLYMSPEQMRAAKEADARSDIWALGVILYELLAGITPFMSEALPELILKIATEAPAPIRDRVPGAPLALEAVILKCLEKDPRKRFATIGELAVALAEFGPRRSRLSVERISGVLREAGLSSSVLESPQSSEPTARTEAGTAASWGQTAPSASGGKRALFALGALLSVAAIAFGAYGVRRLGVKTSASAESSAAPSGPAPIAQGATSAAAPSAVVQPVTSPAESPRIVSAPESSRSLAPVSSSTATPKPATALARPRAKKPAPLAAVAASVTPVLANAAKPKPAPPTGRSVFDDR